MSFSKGILWFFIILHSVNSYAKKPKNTYFEESEIITPFQLTHAIQPVNLLINPGKELLTFSVDDTGKQWLIIYNLDTDNQFKEAYRTPLPNNFHSYDISAPKKDQLQTLYFLSSDKLFILNSSLITHNKPFKPVHNISSLAVGNNPQYMRKADFLMNINNDNYDDIYIADFKNSHVLIQTSNGFKTSTLPIQSQSLFTKESIEYFPIKTYFEDINFDGLLDVLYINEGNLIYFLQDESLGINPLPYYVSINEHISSLDWWNKLGADGESLDQSALQARKVEYLKDLNNDNIIDMAVRFTQSKGVLKKTNDYEIYLGRKEQGKLHFLTQPDSVIKAEGTLTDIQFVDINNDRKNEVLVAGFDIGLSQIIGALLSGSIDQDVHLFYMDEDSNFNEKNKVSKTVELKFSLSSGTSGKPITTLIDVDGDNLKDLLLSDDKGTLKMYLGVSQKRLFAKKPIKHKTILPKQGDMLTINDINNDGKEDILLKYGREDKRELHKIFRILMSP